MTLSRHTMPAYKKGQILSSAAAQRELEQLRDELDATKLSLQNIIEEQDASNEEMEMAAEELHSTNEGLIRLNDELQRRNVELQELSRDMGNLFSSVGIPIPILSDDLCIRRFTARAVKVLNLIAADIGRPISDFKIKLNLPNLQELITEVIETLIQPPLILLALEDVTAKPEPS